MLRYTLRRIFLMLPTLVVISLLAFALNECTPEPVDPSEVGIGNAGQTALQRYDRERNNTKRQAKLRGDNLPLFYVSIRSAAYPDTLNRILPRERQAAARGLIAQYGNWPAIQSYNQQLEKSIRTSLALQETNRDNNLIEVSRLLQQLSNRYESKDLQRILGQIESILAEAPGLQTSIKPTLNQLRQAYENLLLKATPGRHYVPNFRWNGFNNRYHQWISQILGGDLGTSRVNGQDVSERVSNALRWTIRLNLSAFIIAYLLAIPLGVYTAAYAGSGFDRRLNIFLFFIYALPSFWVATLLTQFLASPEWFSIFPNMGVGEVAENASWGERTWVRIYHFFLPVFCLTYGVLAVITRQVRTAMQGILQSDFVRTARAKGLQERRIIWRHAFPNALFPLITMFGSLLPSVIAGSIIIELIFNIPGVGMLTFDSIINEDWPVVYALLLLTAILTVLGILLADLLYAWADPRVQLDTQNQGANG
ncbi:MAG: ABC transporter permease [Bacteroidota bacterium]